MTESDVCNNPDEPCERAAARKWAEIPVCRRCYDRYRRNGHGRAYGAWEKQKEKKTSA
jgi:hypothetical protein